MTNIYFLDMPFLSMGLMIFIICFAFAAITVLFIINYIKKKLLVKLEAERKEREFQKQLLRVSITSQEEERRLLGKDIYEDIASVLGLSNMYLEELFELSDGKDKLFLQLRKMQKHVIEKVLVISHQISPPTIEMASLQQTLYRLLVSLCVTNKLNISVYFHNEAQKLRQEQNMMLFRITVDVVRNIINHSKASFIHIVQFTLADKYVLEVRHDGEGLDQAGFEQLRKQPQGQGLKNISSRLQVLEGHIQFEKEKEVNITSVIIPVMQEKVQVV